MTEPRIDYGRMLDVLGSQVRLMLATANRAPHDRIVAAAPGFTLGDTVRHVGSMYRMAHTWLTTGASPQEWQQRPADGQQVTAYLEESHQALADELAAHQPDDPCSTWYPSEQNYAFWARRMMHESLIHRGDMQSAARIRPRPERKEKRDITLDLAADIPADIEPDITGGVDDDVAVDGVGEVMAVWFAHRLRELGVFGNRTARVLVDIGAAAWLAGMDRANASVTAAPVATPVTDEVRKDADAVVTGDPVRVYLWLWGRLPTDTRFVAVDGDDDAVAQMWALLRLATR